MSVEEARARFIAADKSRAAPNAWRTWQETGAAYWAASHPELAEAFSADPNRLPDVDEIVRLAALVEQARTAIRPAWRFLPGRQRTEQSAQVAWFHETLTALYGPFGLALNRVRGGAWLGVEPLERFLEADPFCFRSGYFKAGCIDALTRMDLEAEHRARLLAVLLNRLNKPTRTEFRHYVRLARYLDTPELRRVLAERHEAGTDPEARHARWILSGLVEGRGHRRFMTSRRRQRKPRNIG